MNSSILRSLSLGLALFAASARAALVIPGADGSDGVLNVTTNTVIDLSQAVTGDWDANNAAHAGKGVYDPAKWAVVFKYADVTIATNATVTFKNHPSRAPVVWLVSGDAAIMGTLSLDGQGFQQAPALAEPGPGGFRGGAGRYTTGAAYSSGLGIGGGLGASASQGQTGDGGGYGGPGGAQYGNPSIVPLVGGSGGGGDNTRGWGGGAGAGAILIAAGGHVRVSGLIRANGGSGSSVYDADPRRSSYSGSGSGGGVRIVAGTIAGNGRISAISPDTARPGQLGRIRIERVINDNALIVVPVPSVVDLADGATALIWPPAGAPEVRIVSIQGKEVPADPRAEFGTIGADVTLPRTGSVLVVVESRNVEQASVVKVRGTPRMNGNYREVDGVVDTVLSESPLIIRWKAELPVQDGYAAVQVKVVRP